MKKPRFKYPSVTEIIEPYTDYSQVDPKVLRAAQIRGNIVHDLSAGYAKFGVVPEGKIPERYRGYLTSFKNWFNAEVVKVLACEERIFNDALRVCGQMDLLVELRGYALPIVVDIKTPVMVQKTWCAQLAAYKFLTENEKQIITGTPASLRVRENGSAALLRPVDNHAEALKYWLKAVECFHYFSTKGDR